MNLTKKESLVTCAKRDSDHPKFLMFIAYLQCAVRVNLRVARLRFQRDGLDGRDDEGDLWRSWNCL